MHSLKFFIVAVAARVSSLLPRPTELQIILPPFVTMLLAPIMGNMMAQVAFESLFILSVLDILAGAGNAWVIEHNFSSHVLREGVAKKLMNLIMVCCAYMIDVMMAAGLDLSSMPIPIPDGSVFISFCVMFCLMEVTSMAEIWAKSHPDARDTPIWKMLAQGKEAQQ